MSNPVQHSDLGAAVDTAVNLGATEVSNSYGSAGPEPDQTFFDHYYDHPGVAITASAGDEDYGTIWPAASPYVTAVGGTELIAGSDYGARLERERLGQRPPRHRAERGAGHRQRLLALGAEAGVAARRRLLGPHGRRRVGGRGQRRDLRLVAGDRRLGRRRRHEHQLAGHRERLRARGQREVRRLRLVSVQPPDELLRRHARGRTSRRARSAATSAPPSPATTARRASARRTASAASSLRGGARGPPLRVRPSRSEDKSAPSLRPGPIAGTMAARMKGIAIVLLAAVVSVTAATTHAATQQHRRRPAHARPAARDQGCRRVAPRLPGLDVASCASSAIATTASTRRRTSARSSSTRRSRSRWPRSSGSSTGCASRSGTAPSRRRTARTPTRAAT